MSSGNQSPELQVQLRLSTRVAWPLIAGVSVLGLLLFAAVAKPLLDAGSLDTLVTFGFALIFVPVLLIAGTRNRRRTAPTIRLGADRLYLPLLKHEAGLESRYRDITSFFVRPGPRGFLWVGTALGHFVYPRRAFEKAEDLERVADHLRHAVQDPLSAPEAKAAMFAEQQAVANEVYKNDPRVVPAVCVVLGLVAIIFGLAGSWERMFSVAGWGANVPGLVRDGQFWRLLTASWVHLDVVQLMFDGLLLAAVGVRIERLLRPQLTLLVILMGGVLGQAALLVSGQAVMSSGAAPMAFALIGAYAFVAHRFKGRMPLGMTPPLRAWVVLGVLLLLIGFTLPSDGFPAYLGGLLGGVLVAGLFVPDDASLPVATTPMAVRAILIALLALHVGAAVWGFVDQQKDPTAAELYAGRGFVEKEMSNVMLLNQFAWQHAVAPQTSSTALALAETAAARAVRVSNEEPAVVDTWATVAFRQGELTVAAEREHAVLQRRSDAMMASQFTRFARALERSDKPARLSHHPVRGARLEVDYPADVKTAYLAVVVEEQPQGLLRVQVPALERSPWLSKQGIEWVWPEEVTLQTVWTTTISIPAESWILEKDVFEYPGPAEPAPSSLSPRTTGL